MAIGMVMVRAAAWWDFYGNYGNRDGNGEMGRGNMLGEDGMHDMGLVGQRQRRWVKPSGGVIKLNIDGALEVTKGVFGTGAVCRDENGTCIGVLAVPMVGFVSPQTCEFLALVNGLHFCLQAGFTRLEIEGDAQNIFQALNSDQEDLSSDGALVDEAKVLLSSFQFCSWGYIPRECNNAAHCVAKVALSLPFPTYWWRMAPDWLIPILVDESL
ncbi:uncharacterized protein LOC133716741 [Rosa rugosa]|uniref:uncharacterized protein LOC133716741 n=1 Tax=Rosa rugosa TaxID=74645 RepID=UPI002B4062DA|nr:uncharacterized protein LOC133716741 [Rosa rugosa]